MNVSKNLFTLPYLPYRCDHGKHDRNRSKRSSAADCAELDAKKVRLRKADADRTVAKRRVWPNRQVQILRLLIRTKIERTHDHHPAVHLFRRRTVLQKLLLLAGRIFAAQIEKFAAEQADSLRPVLQRSGNLAAAANVSKQAKPSASSGMKRHLRARLDRAARALLFPHNGIVSCARLLVRLQKHGPGLRIDDGLCTVFCKKRCHIDTGDSGDAHCSRQNGRV